jgi:hypothetical protein
MNLVSISKKIILAGLLSTFSATIQAGWLPQWISNACPDISTKNTTYIGLGALALAGTGLAGYLWYKKCYTPTTSEPKNIQQDPQASITSVPKKDKGKEKSNDILTHTIFPHFKVWLEACEKLPFFQLITDETFSRDEYYRQNPDHKEGDRLESDKYHDPRNDKTSLELAELDQALTTYFHLNQNDILFNDPHCWVNNELPQKLINSLPADESPVFEPYVQKLVVPHNSKIAFFGDIHGDIHSLNSFLQQLQERGCLDGFEITDPTFYMVFLGDYTDRGWYGAEVIYTILRLKCVNPHNVILVRGNHEQLQEKSVFYKQLCCKFENHTASSSETPLPKLFEKIQKFYETLPLALYLGSGDEQHKDFILCCHGGLEIGFDPLPLLNHEQPRGYAILGPLSRLTTIRRLQLPKNEHLINVFTQANTAIKNYQDLENNILVMNKVSATPFLEPFQPEGLVTLKKSFFHKKLMPLFIGFQWNDYEVNPDHEKLKIPWFIKNHKTFGRGFTLGKTFNEVALALQSDESNTVHGVFRAHQHSPSPEDPMMQRILNTDGHDHDCNAGVGKLWIPSNSKPKHEHSLWDNIVCTFNVCPHTVYQQAGFTSATYGLLTLGTGYQEWKLEIITQKMF